MHISSSHLLLLAALLAACSERGEQSAPPPDAGADASITIEVRSSYWPTYPCTQCHVHAPGTADARERKLTEFHASRADLDHGTLRGWCYRCHDQRNVDRFVLADGTALAFDDSHELCGSCHGAELADWRRGIHGLTTGYWLGPRKVRTCAHCHNPHQPKLAPMQAEPPPARPRTEPVRAPAGTRPPVEP